MRAVSMLTRTTWPARRTRYLQGFAEGEFAGFAAVLIEDGDFGVFKNGVTGGVSGFEFLLDFGSELIGSVLGLPPAAGQAELVADGAVGDDALAAGVSRKLRYQSPAALLGGFVEQGLERSPEAELVGHGLTFQMLEVVEIGFDERVVGGQIEHRSLCIVSGRAGSGKSCGATRDACQGDQAGVA
jgi:hypothetical protein